jgi:hypothetical protein
MRDRKSWFQEIESVEAEGFLVRHKLASLPVHVITEPIALYSVREFTRIIATYDNNSDQPHIAQLQDRQIYHDICSHMLKVVLLPCMSSCNVGDTDSNFVQGLLIKLLYVIPNTKALIVPPVQRPDYMQLLVERIQILAHLEEFRFHVGCTTEVIIELSKYCPHMKNISVKYSKGVDDNCVQHLLELGRLQTLNVADTSVSNNGYRALLLGLSELKEVVWLHPIDPVLSNLTRSLHTVRKFVGKVSDPELLVRNCPNVTDLILLSVTEDISVVGALRSVTFLSLLISSCTVVRFAACISRLGRTLSKLDLYQVVNINFDDLINYCIVLNSLVMCYCHVTCTETYHGQCPHFINLTRLTLKENWGPCDFRCALHLYVNLKALHVSGMGHLTDAFVAQLLTAGGFRNVTEFFAEHCGDLSMETAWLLLQDCPHLTKIGNINSWPGIVKSESMTFLNFVKHNNLSLTVIF